MPCAVRCGSCGKAPSAARRHRRHRHEESGNKEQMSWRIIGGEISIFLENGFGQFSRALRDDEHRAPAGKMSIIMERNRKCLIVVPHAFMHLEIDI